MALAALLATAAAEGEEAEDEVEAGFEEAETELVLVELGWSSCLLNTKNHNTRKMIPRLMRVKRTRRKMASGLLVVHNKPSLAQHPTSTFGASININLLRQLIIANITDPLLNVNIVNFIFQRN